MISTLQRGGAGSSSDGLQAVPIQVSLRYNFEYGTENTTEGQNVCLTLIASF